MTKLIIIALFAVAAVVVWAWIRQRRGLAQGVNKPSAEGQPPADDSQAGPPTGAHHRPSTEGYAPAQSREIVPTASEITESASVPTETGEVAPSPLSPQPLAEPAFAAPVEPTLTSVDVSCPSSNERTPRKHDEAVCEFDRTEPGPASPPIASLRNEEAVALAETPESEPSVPQTTPATPSADTALVDETATQPGMADEKPTKIPASWDTAAASPPATAPSLSDETESATREGAEPPLAEDEPLPRARRYSEPKPSPTTKTSTKAERKPDPTPRTDASLPIRLQLVFGRGGSVTTLALVPNRREGMPNNIDVTAAHGRFRLSEWSADSYEPVSVSDVPDALSEGVVWQARDGAQRWRWELSKRELYVLAAGDEFGLRGFVTRRKDQRLWLNTRHVILAKESLRDQVLAALSEAGCATPEVSDSTTPGVPVSGWILFRDVKPTRAVPMRDERDILNVLCPAHEIEPQFVGGIRLERNVWLAGFPPRIRFTGEMGSGFQVLIDEQPAQLASDGAFESPGWDAEGEHRLCFGDRAEMYSLRTMEEEWEPWQVHDFGTGAAICGARIDGARWRQFCIPAANPLLLGARPGEIFRCRGPNEAHTDWILALVPFTPAWALPIDRLPKKNCSATLVLLEFTEPLNTLERPLHKLNATSALRKWVFAIRNARRNQFQLAVQGEDAKALWRRYGVVAKKLRRQLR